jgi:hypothetical protein
MEYIDIRKLNLDELVGVVNLYPWFGGARKELCRRMRSMGAEWDMAQYADAAMYVCAREKVSDIMRSGRAGDWSDADVEKLIKSYLSEKQEVETKVETRKVYAGVGDYFSQEEYDNVRSAEDHVFSRYAAKARREKPEISSEGVEDLGFYTETLAQIYAEQGYYSQAKKIYSKLILAYPEKSAYFASLIQKIDEIN